VVAITEDGLRSNVRAGENSGRTLVHSAVVRRLVTIGDAQRDQASARTEIGLDREWQGFSLAVRPRLQQPCGASRRGPAGLKASTT
jgi:hypothetical protein